MSFSNEAIGQSEAFVAFQERLSRAAAVDRPVLLLGERGTGKELAARRLHYLSTRWEGPLVTLNCAALAPTLIESELFGHEADAFTGAGGRREGRFELASEGTLFLDEIGNIPMEGQEKILRVVEYGTFERVGGAAPVEVDVRIVAATNINLKAAAERGIFKADLLDRLSFEVLVLPPLRDRRGDVLLLATHFAARMAHELGLEAVPAFSDDALEALEGYAWPGNVRELKNVVERAVYRAGAGVIDEIVFDPFPDADVLRPLAPPDAAAADASSPTAVPDPGVPPPDRVPDDAAEMTVANLVRRLGPVSDFADSVADLEVEILRLALARARFNQRQAADDLNLTYHQFRGLYRKYADRLRDDEDA